MSPALLESDLHALTVGSGTPLVTLHGGPGFDHTYLRPWLDPLSRRAHLTYFDQRGHGRSARPGAIESLSHESWAKDVEALRETLRVERFVLFGHSWGSFIALEYALRYPHRLLGLILCSAAPALDYTAEALELARARATAEQFQALLEALSTPAPDDAALGRRWRAILPVYFADPRKTWLEGVDARVRYDAAAFNRAMFGCIPQYDVTDRLGEIHVPTLVLVGAHDWITPPGAGAGRLVAGLPHASVELFEHSGHFPFIEEHARFLERLESWLGALESEAS